MPVAAKLGGTWSLSSTNCQTSKYLFAGFPLVCLEALKDLGCYRILLGITGSLSHVKLSSFSLQCSRTDCSWRLVLHLSIPYWVKGTELRIRQDCHKLCKGSNIHLQFACPLESFQAVFFRQYICSSLKCCLHWTGRQDIAGICSSVLQEWKGNKF